MLCLTSDAQHSADLSAETVSAIANLARLSLNDTQSAEYAQSLNKILGMMETLKGINTDGVEPLKSPSTTLSRYVMMWLPKPIIVSNTRQLHQLFRMACTSYRA